MNTEEEIAALLHIHEKASAHGDMLKNIADGALKRLKTINDEMTVKPVEPKVDPVYPIPTDDGPSEPEPSTQPTLLERKL
jgi:hypothetical protein